MEFKGRYRTVPVYVKEFGYGGMLLDLFKGVALNFVGKNGNFDKGNISEVDAANMRKLATELSVYLSLVGVYLALSMAFRGDDEDEQHSLNITLNMVNRVKGELAIYINPLELARMAKNPAPAMSIIEDTVDIMTAVGKGLVGKDTIENGIYAGESRFYKSIRSYIPGLSQYQSTISNSKQEFNRGLLYNLANENE
jgi:hypothetical protein